MKIVVIGTRGIPEIQGGVETHCQELYPRIAAMGHDVTVIRRKPYVNSENRMHTYKGVWLADLYAPRKKSLEAIVHTALAVIKARTMNPDILHVHAVGPALMVPLARLLGMKVVMTNHGPDYERQKWGRAAKAVIKLGERLGTRYSNRIIVISKVISSILANNYGRHDSTLIYNGVNTPEPAKDTGCINALGLSGGDYILAMGRFVKEKGFDDLINAYKMLPAEIRSRFKLVIAGNADHADRYSDSLHKLGNETEGVIMPGFVRGEARHQLLSHAALFAMPSYHEGLPIALLEALSYHLDVAVSNIPANCIDPLCRFSDFYQVGDIEGLTSLINKKLSDTDAGKPARRNYNLAPYNWDNIAASTVELYRTLL
ncbi:glycosyltransferase family 4 protein [uncultured Muribaculum sp.]|uniref:glycosyltransferase family 4 protein n=1 Tax=uncultured Muribaculum sp. TaxID=1918613 RepID=UPI00267671BC|nr:glycosyltransferase family 4 protein [uncultured Muribaculum sp.]